MMRTDPLPFIPHRYDSGRDGYIDLMELKLMMEKLGAPQTHLGLKNMIKEVDEDFDGKLSFREVRWHRCSCGCGCGIERRRQPCSPTVELSFPYSSYCGMW